MKDAILPFFLMGAVGFFGFLAGYRLGLRNWEIERAAGS